MRIEILGAPRLQWGIAGFGACAGLVQRINHVTGGRHGCYAMFVVERVPPGFAGRLSVF